MSTPFLDESFSSVAPICLYDRIMKTKTMEGLDMTRTFSILFSLFFFTLNSALSQSKTNTVPPEALNWNADIYMTNFSPSQEEKVKKAVEIIKKIIATEEFRDRVLNYEYKGEKKFFDNHGLSNEEVYQKIIDGAEIMGNKTKNNTMDVELELYHQSTTTIGYTYPNTVRIWMNTKYFNKYTPIKVADNLMHEWMHKLGFTHAMTWSKDRDHSVPYAIGYLLEELANKNPQ